MNFLKLIGLCFFATTGFAQKPIHYHAHDHARVVNRSVHGHQPTTGSRVIVTPRQQNALNLHGHNQAPMSSLQNTHNHSDTIVNSRHSKRQPLSVKETHHGHHG